MNGRILVETDDLDMAKIEIPFTGCVTNEESKDESTWYPKNIMTK
ncbi:MAG: hypothetical protein ACYS1A_08770 [Planctomycetota bacterium]